MSKEWTDAENDLIVADYLEMLKVELAGGSYNKTQHRSKLASHLNRTNGSIEFKHQNVSAVLKGLGEAWIIGYKPAFNFQQSLIDAVLRGLALQDKSIENATVETSKNRGFFTDFEPLWIGPAPTLSNVAAPDESEQMAAIARKFDVAARDERNRSLGKAGEELVFRTEVSRLKASGKSDLAERVRWISQLEGDGVGYDILSFEENGRERLLEVKTTNGWERTPFHISRNELRVSGDCPDTWSLVRVWDFARKPKAFELQPPLERHVELMPTSYQAKLH